MKVKKRNGELVRIRIDEITDHIQSLCYELDEMYIDPFKITQTIVSSLKDGISTTEINSFSAQKCFELNTDHPDFAVLAGRLMINDHHKNISVSTGIKYTDIAKALLNNVDQLGEISPLLNKPIEQIVKLYPDEINAIIVIDRDYSYDYFGFKTLCKSYLMKVKNTIIESPQHMILRVAMGIHASLENVSDRDTFMNFTLPAIKETYDMMSTKQFTHATPTLFNAGTPYQSMFSCFLLGMHDSVGGIFDCIKDMAHISKYSGGIGLHAHDIRSKGSFIRKTGGKSDGLVPMLKVINATAKYINQSGRRNGSIAIYLEPWHADVESVLDCKLNHGDPEIRARDLFYAMWTPDLFMQRVSDDTEWSLMDPSVCTGLSDVYGDTFKELYERYEREGKFIKKIKARVLMAKIINTQIETGGPYVLFKDRINKLSNQMNIGVVKSSNLCCEITEVSNTEKYACCVLGSMVLSTFVDKRPMSDIPLGTGAKPVGVCVIGNEEHFFNHEKLAKAVKVLTCNLNKIIDNNYYSVAQTEVSNKSERPIGIGVQGLADVFFHLQLPFEGADADMLNKEIFETIYYAALESSNELAERDGSYPSYEGSPISKGLFQFDLWDMNPAPGAVLITGGSATASSGVTNNSGRWDWDDLRNRILKHGLRNSLVTALMPTASTSQIMGSASECFEPITSNLYTRRTSAGEFMCFNKYLIRDLISAKLWTNKVKNALIKDKGSIQAIDGIPADLKEVYKTVWEIEQKNIIKMAVSRGRYVDQAQSLNLFFAKPDFNKIYAALMFGWKMGSKNGSYYIRTKAATSAMTVPGKTVLVERPVVSNEPEPCESCSA